MMIVKPLRWSETKAGVATTLCGRFTINAVAGFQARLYQRESLLIRGLAADALRLEAERLHQLSAARALTFDARCALRGKLGRDIDELFDQADREEGENGR